LAAIDRNIAMFLHFYASNYGKYILNYYSMPRLLYAYQA